MAGYGGSAVCFFAMVDKLREEFEITMVDVLGFGCSGRPDYSVFTIDKVLHA